MRTNKIKQNIYKKHTERVVGLVSSLMKKIPGEQRRIRSPKPTPSVESRIKEMQGIVAKKVTPSKDPLVSFKHKGVRHHFYTPSKERPAKR